MGPSQTEYVEAAIIFRLSCAIFVFFFQLMPRIAGETLFKRNEYLMFQRKCFLSDATFASALNILSAFALKKRKRKKGFFRIDYIPENYAEVLILIFQI